MDEKVLAYRKKYKKCKYCKYLKLIIPGISLISSYYKCTAKDEIIRDSFPDMRNIWRICSCYQVDEREKE